PTPVPVPAISARSSSSCKQSGRHRQRSFRVLGQVSGLFELFLAPRLVGEHLRLVELPSSLANSIPRTLCRTFPGTLISSTNIRLEISSHAKTAPLTC